MIRTQISLDPAQAEALKRIGRDRDSSMAAVIREAVDRLIADERNRDQALGLIGAFSSGSPDTSAKHDQYLEESYR